MRCQAGMGQPDVPPRGAAARALAKRRGVCAAGGARARVASGTRTSPCASNPAACCAGASGAWLSVEVVGVPVDRGRECQPELIPSLPEFAASLGQFLRQMHGVSSTNGPSSGSHNFYRGGSLLTYDEEGRRAISALAGKVDFDRASAVWQAATRAHWTGQPVWVHGDLSLGNLLMTDGRLCAVIDFGQMCAGDPACDLAIAWTLFRGESREVFKSTLDLDADTWNRGRGWALWKAVIVAAGMAETNAVEGRQCWRTIEEVLADHDRS